MSASTRYFARNTAFMESGERLVPSREWEIWRESNALIRIRMTTDNCGNVDQLAAQLEVWPEDTWWPVVRYDSAHYEVHGDYINPRGVTSQKDWLNLR